MMIAVCNGPPGNGVPHKARWIVVLGGANIGPRYGRADVLYSEPGHVRRHVEDYAELFVVGAGSDGWRVIEGIVATPRRKIVVVDGPTDPPFKSGSSLTCGAPGSGVDLEIPSGCGLLFGIDRDSIEVVEIGAWDE